jgi:hypothetical protein
LLRQERRDRAFGKQSEHQVVVWFSADALWER